MLPLAILSFAAHAHPLAPGDQMRMLTVGNRQRRRGRGWQSSSNLHTGKRQAPAACSKLRTIYGGLGPESIPSLQVCQPRPHSR